VSGAPGTWLRLAAAGARPAEPPAGPDRDVEWAVRPEADGLAIAAHAPRALLAGAYGLLAAAGCPWSPFGPGDETVPDRATARRRVEPLAARPAFARRAWAADVGTWHYTVPERLGARLPADVGFVDWMAKTDATGLLFIRHANDSQWVVPELVPALARRGLAVEWGGHALPELLPRELFGTHPTWFPVDASGRRTDFGNACTASRDALAAIRARALATHAARDADGDVHVWGLDLLGGGWCRCGACRDLGPSDQALRVVNAVAEGLPAGTRAFHLAYHDTIVPPRAVRPAAAVWAEFAPRERCYAHGIGDAACATNASYRDALAAHVERFDGRVEVFEYYGDAILFGGCIVPLAGVVAADLEWYRRAGVRGVSCLTFGTYSLLAHGVGIEAFARGALDPAAAAEAPEAHGRTAYGPHAAAMAAYFRAVERLMAEVVTYGDVKLPPRDGARGHGGGAAFRRARAALPAARRLLGAAAGAPRAAAHARLLDYTAATLDGLAAWLADDGAAPDAALATLAGALAHVRDLPVAEIGTWGAYDLEVTHAFYEAALRTPGPRLS
jgi:hypothetical protein